MGTEQDAGGLLWQIARNDIHALQWCAVVSLEYHLLGADRHTILLELTDNPLSAEVVGTAIHRTRTKVALLLAERIGTVWMKRWSYWYHRSLIRCGVLLQVST